MNWKVALVYSHVMDALRLLKKNYDSGGENRSNEVSLTLYFLPSLFSMAVTTSDDKNLVGSVPTSSKFPLKKQKHLLCITSQLAMQCILKKKTSWH